MKIYAPVKDFNGWRNNIRFVNGVGETENPVLISWFQSRGYKVEQYTPIPSIEKCENPLEIALENCDEPNFDAMTPNELREWMKSNGFGSQIKNIRNKEKLLEIIRG